LEDRVADNTDKFDITESESLLIGRNFGIGTDIQTGPNGNLFVVSLSKGAIYEIYRTDVCLQDDARAICSASIRSPAISSLMRCGSDGMTVTGRADVTRRGCTLELRGALISAELSGCPTSALNTGTAIIRATPVGPTFLIRDRGAVNTCSCR